MLEGKDVFILLDDNCEYVYGVFETQEAVDKFFKDEYLDKIEEIYDIDDFESEEEFKEFCKEKIAAIESRKYYEAGYILTQSTFYKEV